MSDAYRARLAMVKEQIESRGIRDLAVLAAMRTVPRHEFVPEDAIDEAYGDHALGIGHKGTISQPYVVAHMTELCELKAGERVLEVGTGSGYQAAVLAEITDRVFSIEISEPLLRRAALRLKRLRYDVRLRWGDGGHGWPEAAPFDAVVVTAAPALRVPEALFDQLAPWGRLVAPVGESHQHLELFVRRDGEIVRSRGAGVRFVPMVGTGSA